MNMLSPISLVVLLLVSWAVEDPFSKSSWMLQGSVIPIAEDPLSMVFQGNLTDVAIASSASIAEHGAYFAPATTALLLMMGGGVLAFCMIFAEFQLISITSVMTVAIVGVFKEVVIIASAVLVYGDELSLYNSFGILVTIAGVALYNWLKIRKRSSSKSLGKGGGGGNSGALREKYDTLSSDTDE